MRWIPNYAAAQLEVKLFLRPAAFEPQRSPRRGGVAAHESVGDVRLSTTATLRVLVTNVAAGTPLRAHDLQCTGCFATADYLY